MRELLGLVLLAALIPGPPGLAGPLGLMPEQWEPVYGISLGNFPQAYSHLALINAAVRLSHI